MISTFLFQIKKKLIFLHDEEIAIFTEHLMACSPPLAPLSHPFPGCYGCLIFIFLVPGAVVVSVTGCRVHVLQTESLHLHKTKARPPPPPLLPSLAPQLLSPLSMKPALGLYSSYKHAGMPSILRLCVGQVSVTVDNQQRSRKPPARSNPFDLSGRKNPFTDVLNDRFNFLIFIVFARYHCNDNQ